MRRLLLVLVIIAAFITPFSRPAPASAAGQILEWESGPGFATFGANASVFIALGTVEFQCDFIFPTANIYVVQGTPGDGAALVDVSGSPNTVVGATGGVFADTIAITQPSGTLGEGVYTVVYDECQDGSFDDGIDAVFPDAFEVVLPSTLPPIDPAIGALKASAGDLADKMKAVLTILDLYEAYQEIQEAIECMTSPGECVIAMIADELTGAILDQIRLMLGLSVDPKLAARDAALDTISHWEGIEADPPDPAFEQHTLIERPAAIDPESGDPLVEAEVALGNAHLTEGALAAALLHAIERYQGAQLADDGDWTLVHARETHNFATLMAEQLLDSNLALTNLVNALNTDTRDIDQVSATLSADRQRIVASGFLPDEVQVLRNLGLDQAGMAALRARIAEQGAGSVSESVLIAALNGLIAANSSAITDMQVLATAMDAAIAAILLDPATDDNFPVADAGGSYTAAEGTSLALDGSGSSALIGSLATHAWDLDGDGAFDDALGATPSVSFDDPLDGFIGLKVTDDRGLTGVSYAAINIVSTNSPPVISSVSPDAFHPEIIVGTSQTFSVTATDPDGDGISVAWLLDGESAGSGSSFVYTPLEADGLGGHWLRASVSAGGDTRVYDWTPLVLLPDADSDGWRANIDCDDTDVAVNPSATEILGNGKDEDCDTATPDDGDGPLAFFNPVMSGGGSNVARYEDGARAVLFSQTTPLAAQLPNVMLDDYLGTPQQQWTTSAPNPFTIVDLAGDEPVVIDRVSVRGATNASFSVRTFDIAVSTTTTDDSAFTTVVSGTVLPPTTTHQFILPAPVLAKYIRYKPVGSSGVTMTTRLQAWTGQVGSGTTVTFGNLSTDANGDIVSYAWDFGDGSPTSNAESPTHTFPGAGSYTVTLTVTDAIGNTGVFSVVQQIVPPPSQPDILLFGPTLVAGATSPEYFEARRLGLTPRIIDTNEWQAMTAAEFASYKAIVLGDNFGTQAGPINQAATNSANWKPAVTGNIIVLGGDLAAHAAKGGGEMINRSIQFAMAQPGKTGIVILLGGYFFQAGANTVVPVLEVLRPGEFRVQGAGCYDPAHFTASHPAFSGLTDANLTGWACSVHETFNVIPSDFVVITAALGIGTYVNTDGSIGQPHIVASGTNITPITRITLAPASATNDPGQPQSMTATVKNGTIATPNTTVTFTVTSGPHTGVTGTAITNASGVAIFSYTGSQSGVDEIVASFVDGTAVTHSSNVASVTWSQPSVSVNAGDDQTVVEGDIVSLVSTFSNSDSIASHSATIDWGDGTIEDGIVSESAGAGSVTGSHQYLDNGTYSVALCVTDTSAITSCDTLIVTVSNAAPVVTALTVPAQLAGTAATLDLASFFDEGTLDSHTATIDWGDGTIEPATIGHEAGLTGPIAHHAGEHSSDAFGNVSGTHAYSTAGDYTVTITVTDDDGDSGTATFTLSVTTANGAPVLSAIGEQTLNEGATLAISVLALDPDGDPLTLTPAGLPAFATFTTNGSGSATLTLTPGFDDAGTYAGVTITASDGTLAASQTFTITVTNSNRPPTVDASGPYSVDEGGAITVTATSNDPDGDIVSIGWDIDGDGVFETSGASTAFSAAALDGPGVQTITVQASDGDLATMATATVTIVNVAPTIDAVTAGSPIDEGGGSTIIVTASDPALANDPLTYQFDCDGNGVFEIGPQPSSSAVCNYLASGVYTVGILVDDGDGGTVTASTVVTVAATNGAPSASAGGPYAADEGGSLTISATGDDPDDDTLTFAWDLDDDGAFETTGASVSFPATAIDGPAIATIHVQACDSLGLCDSDTTTVVVSNVAPVVEAGNNLNAGEGSAVSLDQSSFTDPGNDIHTVRIAWGDGTHEVFDLVQGERVITRSHVYQHNFDYLVLVGVCDDDGACVNDSFTALIAPVAPVIDPIADITVTVGEPIDSTATWTDSSAEEEWTTSVTYGDGIREGAVLTTIQPISLLHTYDAAGDYPLNVCVNDGTLFTCAAATVHVLDVAANLAPVVDAGADLDAVTGQPFSSSGSFADPDSLTWTATVDYGDGSGVQPLTLNPDGTFALTHTYSTDGSATITVCVTDDDTGQGCDEATVSVSAAARDYAIFAGHDGCGSGNSKALEWSGSSTSVSGDVHSNSGLKISGSRNRVDGATTYRCDKHISGSRHTFSGGLTQVSAVQPWPLTITVDDFDCDISVSGKLNLSKDGPWWVGGKKHSRTLRPLTLCAGEITLSGSSIRGEVTLVAGNIRISGSNLRLTAHEHGVLALATGDSHSTIKISGSSNLYSGDLVARSGAIDLSGSCNTINGSIAGWTVKLSGSSWRIGAQ